MYTIMWDFSSWMNNSMSFFSREEANEAVRLLRQSGAINLRAKADQPKEPTSAPKKIALVAFKLYGYEVPADTKEGDFITVISGGQPVRLEVLRMTDERIPGINYVSAEEVIRK